MSDAPPYTLDDPRPIASEAPYTFFLPSTAELIAIGPGDLAKLIFRPAEPGRKFDAERMWVRIDGVDGDLLQGRLWNEPEDIPGLAPDDPVVFPRDFVIDCQWDEARKTAPPAPAKRPSYWERCLVDRCVIDDGAPVHFLYREEPQPTPEDGYADSGWTIRGDYRGLSDAEIDARETEFVALGLVLNVDDSWLHLIDEPIGSAFIRDWESGTFVKDE
jgi:hypothetical protein